MIWRPETVSRKARELVACNMGDRPDSKSKRYDRQIRIWGAEGQQRLESSRIALLNCSATGAETLKNLVLGGIASFTIVDGNKVTAWDLGNNFLVDQSRMGQSRAQAVTDLLKEMNDSVSGSYVEDTPEQLLESRPEFLAGYDLVIATQVRPRCCRAERQCVACRMRGSGKCQQWSLLERLVQCRSARIWKL